MRGTLDGGHRPEAGAALRAGREGGRVLDGLERRAERVDVLLGDPVARVEDGHGHLHVREARREDPVVAVDGTGVQDLRHHLDVGLVEEPEVPAVGRQRHGRSGTRASVRFLPHRGQAEASVVQTQRRRVHDAGRRAAGRDRDGQVQDAVPEPFVADTMTV